eukprot:2379874-Rhodomonas_salina.1
MALGQLEGTTMLLAGDCGQERLEYLLLLRVLEDRRRLRRSAPGFPEPVSCPERCATECSSNIFFGGAAATPSECRVAPVMLVVVPVIVGGSDDG